MTSTMYYHDKINFMRRECVKDPNNISNACKLIGYLYLNAENEVAEKEAFNYLNNGMKNLKMKSLYAKILIKLNKFEKASQFLEKELTEKLEPKLLQLLSYIHFSETKNDYNEAIKSTNMNKVTARGRYDHNSESQHRPIQFQQTDISLLSASKARVLFTIKNKSTEVHTIPQSDKIFTSKYPIKEVACGTRFYAVLDSIGRVFTWGNESACAIGYPISALKFKHISTGFEHCAAISDDDMLYTWGIGAFGKLGLGTASGDKKVTTPSLVASLSRQKVKKVSCFGMNTSVITKNGDMYVFGRNHRHQLGLLNADYIELNPIPNRRGSKRPQPTIMTPISKMKENIHSLLGDIKFSDLHVTFQDKTFYLHTFILGAKVSQLLTFFENEFEQQKQTNNNEHVLKFNLKDFLVNVHFQTHSDLFRITESAIFIENILNSLTMDKVSNVFGQFYGEPLQVSELNQNEIITLFQIFGMDISEVKKSCSNFSFTKWVDLSSESVYNKNSLLSDFKVKTADDKLLYLHRGILSSRSPYFANLFNSNMVECIKGEIKIDLEYTVADSLFKYFYSDRFTLPENCTGDDLLSLLDQTNLYEIERLKCAMEKLISVSLDLDNAIPLLLYAKDRDAYQLVEFTIDFIAKNIDFMDVQEIQNLPPQLFTKIKLYAIDPEVSVVGGQYTPKHVLQGLKIIDISQGEKLTLALDTNNQIHQLGYGSNHSSDNVVSTVILPTTSKVASIAAGSSHALVITENSEIYGWGAGFLGQLGDRKTFYFIPTQLTSNYPNVDTGSCGSWSSFTWTGSKTHLLSPEGPKPVINECPYFKTSSSSSTDSDETLIDVWEQLKESKDTDCTIHVYPSGNTKDADIIDLLVKLDVSSSGSDSKSTISSNNDVSTTTTTDTTNEFHVLKVHSSILPKLLLQRFQTSSNQLIYIFGFSLNVVKKLLEFQYTDKISLNGEDFLSLLLLSQDTGACNLSNNLFCKLKDLTTVDLAISLLKTLHQTNNYLKVPFVTKFLLNYLLKNISVASKSDDFLSLPKEFLALL